MASDSLSIRNRSPKIHVPQSSGNSANRLTIKILHNIYIYIYTHVHILYMYIHMYICMQYN